MVELEDKLVEFGEIEVGLGKTWNRLKLAGVTRLFLKHLLSFDLRVRDFMVASENPLVRGASVENEFPIGGQFVHVIDGDASAEKIAQLDGREGFG